MDTPYNNYITVKQGFSFSLPIIKKISVLINIIYKIQGYYHYETFIYLKNIWKVTVPKGALN